MSDFMAKKHQIQFRLGLRPRPPWGSSQRSSRLPSWIYGKEGEGKGWEGREGKGREGMGRKGREGKRREGKSPSTLLKFHKYSPAWKSRKSRLKEYVRALRQRIKVAVKHGKMAR